MPPFREHFNIHLVCHGACCPYFVDVVASCISMFELKAASNLPRSSNPSQFRSACRNASATTVLGVRSSNTSTIYPACLQECYNVVLFKTSVTIIVNYVVQSLPLPLARRKARISSVWLKQRSKFEQLSGIQPRRLALLSNCTNAENGCVCCRIKVSAIVDSAFVCNSIWEFELQTSRKTL